MCIVCAGQTLDILDHCTTSSCRICCLLFLFNYFCFLSTNFLVLKVIIITGLDEVARKIMLLTHMVNPYQKNVFFKCFKLKQQEVTKDIEAITTMCKFVWYWHSKITLRYASFVYPNYDIKKLDKEIENRLDSERSKLN